MKANAITVNATGGQLATGDYTLLECTETLSNTGTFGTPTISGLFSGTASIIANAGSNGSIVLRVYNPPKGTLIRFL